MTTWPTEQKSNTMAINTLRDEQGGAASGATALATVAATGSDQAGAASVDVGFTLVSAADGTKGVKLPAAAAGKRVEIKNNVNAVLKVYPATGDAINAIAANSALSMAALTSAVFNAYDDTTWYTTPLVPS